MLAYEVAKPIDACLRLEFAVAHAVEDLDTEILDAYPHLGPSFFILMQFLVKFYQNKRLPPNSWDWRSPCRGILNPLLTRAGGKCEKLSTSLSDTWG